MAHVKIPREEWKETPLRKNFDVAGGVIWGSIENKLIEAVFGGWPPGKFVQ